MPFHIWKSIEISKGVAAVPESERHVLEKGSYVDTMMLGQAPMDFAPLRIPAGK